MSPVQKRRTVNILLRGAFYTKCIPILMIGTRAGKLRSANITGSEAGARTSGNSTLTGK